MELRQLQQTAWIGIDRLPRAEADLRRYFQEARLKPPIPRVRTEATALDVTLTDPPWSLVAAWRRRAVRPHLLERLTEAGLTRCPDPTHRG